MIAEIIVISIIFLAGALLLSSFGLRGWGILPLGFTAGLSLFTITVFLQTISSVYIRSVLPLFLCLIFAASLWLYRKKNNKSIILPIKYILLGFLLIAVSVFVFSELNLFRYHYDSIRYLMTGSLIHFGHLDIISTNLLDKRFSSVSALHSLAHFSDSYYLRSLTPLISLSVFGSLFWFLQTGFKNLKTKKLLGFGAFGVLLLLTNNAYIFHSFYLNGHLLIGLYMLIAVAAGWLLIKESSSKSLAYLQVLQILCVAGLVMTRVEGFVYAALAILPTVLSPNVKMSHKKLLASSVGIFIVVQELANIALRLDRGIDVPARVKALLIFGVLIIIFSQFLSWKIFKYKYTRLLWISEIGLWAVVAALFIKDQEILTKSVYSTIQNTVFIPSPWGYSLVILTVLIAIILLFFRFKDQAVLRFTVTTFIPAVLLIAYLRGSGYRVAHADSLNRMLIQIVPLVVFFIIVAAIYSYTAKPVKKTK